MSGPVGSFAISIMAAAVFAFGLRTGTALGRFLTVTRSESPFFFWTMQIVWAAMAVISAGIGVWRWIATN
jgi:hypothetical protein